MTLLTEVMDRPLDPGYAAEAADPGPRGPWRIAGVAVLALVLGLVAAIATVQLRRPDPVADEARDLLIAQIEARTLTADERAATVTDLTGQIADLRAQARGPAAGAILSGMRADTVTTGLAPVTGPGLVVTLAETREYVQDIDLQRVVNTLWAGGAEAIAINGHRLTPLSAIRTAGDAILVDLEPLKAPYQVSAIGDADAMGVQMVRSGTTDALRVLDANYGIRSSTTATSSLDLPGSGPLTLHYARVTG